LTTFCRVADEGSFTRAAESLNLSQPTVTKQIQRLEAIFGVSLIYRSQRGISLTEAGEVVYSYARRIFHTLQKCHEALENLQEPGRGELTVAAVPVVALYTLPPIIETFRSENPLITLQVRSGVNKDVINHVVASDADVGFTTMPATHAHVITRPLFHDRVLLVASPGTAEKLNYRVTPDTLSRLPMIAYERRSQFRSFVNSSFEAAGINPNIVMEFDSHEVVKTMVQLDLGLAMVPESAVRSDLQAGRLATVEIVGFPPLARTTCMIIRRGRQQSPALTRFVSLVESLFPDPGTSAAPARQGA
jgi:DNA-binding transcriptional LysR family regulator